ncbi:glycoside hydrolase family 5 protein [Carboxylicivirga sp. N1Y90]|uniref:glycoside hydrolase family 5 protein n=1 Tax=Carboxylicivirga fragile TaxID=3417571 RepID=UPI003D33E864|nr:cellulase family glycosylhydrolase [Marinilabiliaceae bacterium N1Y90]
MIKRSIKLFFVCFIFNYSVLQAQSFQINNGINVSHWLSQTDIRGDERAQCIQKIDFETIASHGFDHVRLPVDEKQLWDENGNIDNVTLNLLKQGIDWAHECKLKVIVDLHSLRSHHFVGNNQRIWNDSEAQIQFIDYWKELSSHLKEYPNKLLAYEILNEAVAEDPNDWNKLIRKAISAIREKEPKRTIVIGSNKWQQVYSFPELKLPENDTNLILSFHFYEPFLVSHYKTSWNTIGTYNGPIVYPGYAIDTLQYPSLDKSLQEAISYENHYYDRETMEERILIAVKIAKKHKLQLYCGEFGCFPSTPLAIRKAIYTDWISIFD